MIVSLTALPEITARHVRMIEAARLKARAPIAAADCFAAVTAAAHGLTLLTGDPELLSLADSPCALEDLRAS
jgi:predicted nucleic acid-binding protein